MRYEQVKDQAFSRSHDYVIFVNDIINYIAFVVSHSPTAMDTDEIVPHIESTMLSYDDTVAYEKQLPTEEELAAATRTVSLANRIGNSRVYLLSESTAATSRTTKVRLVP